MEKRELHVWPRSAPDRPEGPVGIEEEGKFAIAAEFAAGQLAGFKEIQDHEVEQRLVRCGASRPVPVEVGEFAVPERRDIGH